MDNFHLPLLVLVLTVACARDLSRSLQPTESADGPDGPDLPTEGPGSLVNEFDMDGDGFMPPEAQGPFNEKWGSDSPFALPDNAFGDCLDVVNPRLVDESGIVVDPARIHPNEPPGFPSEDTPYDGVDSDCGRDNDFDADRDGFIDAHWQEAFLTFVDVWGYEAELPNWVAENPAAGLDQPAVGDCDDMDPETWPGAVERVGDGIDQDCNSRPDTAFFGNGGFTWTEPRSPELGRLGQNIILFVSAASANLGVTSDFVSVGIPIPASGRGPAEPLADLVFDFNGPSIFSEGDYIDVEQLPGESLIAVADYSDDVFSGSLYVSYIALDGQGQPGLDRQATAVFDNYAFGSVNIDIAADPLGGLFLLNCSFGGAAIAYVPSVTDSVETFGLDNSVSGASMCFIRGYPVAVGTQSTATFEVCDTKVCRDRTFSNASNLIGTGTGLYSAATTYGDQESGDRITISGSDGRLVFADGTDVELLPSSDVARERILHADVSRLGAAVATSPRYVVGIIERSDGNREVWLQHGTPGAWVYQNLEYTSPPGSSAVPSGVAIHVDDDRLVVAVSARDETGPDHVSWVLLAPADK